MHPPACPEFQAVRAAAGSGKTYDLTSRFVRFLGQADPQAGERPGFPRRDRPSRPDRPDWAAMLAVTFTNKAAAEMQQRVLRSLKERALDLPASRAPHHPAAGMPPALAAIWCDTILRRLSRCNIKTIDSLLFQSIRLSCLSLGLPPSVEPVFDESDIFEPLYDQLVDDARRDPALAALLEAACREGLEQGLAKGFSPAPVLKETLAETLAFLGESDLPLVEDRQILAARLEELRLAAREACRHMAEHLADAGWKVSANFTKFLEKVLALDAFADLPDSAYLHKESLADCLLKASRHLPQASDEALYALMQKTVREAQRATPILRQALALLPQALLARRLAPRLQAMQRRLALLPKGRWEALAQRLFQGEEALSEAYCRLGVRLLHLCIDEFQDTSLGQWTALEPLAVEALAKGGSVYYVGDVKQAIYGWRGGRADLFDSVPARPALAGHAGCFHLRTLEANWRSAPAIVAWNNDLFALLEDPDVSLAVAQAMLSKDDQRLDKALAARLQTTFRGCAQRIPPHKLEAGRDAGHVTVRAVASKEEDDALLPVKRALRTVLADVLSRRPPGEVALLARSNLQVQTLSAWLLEWGVPVVAEASLLLKAHPVVDQLVQLLAFLDYPGDDLAFWRFISGAEVFLAASGMTLAQALDWASQVRANRPEGDGGPPLSSCFARDFPEIHARWIAPLMRHAVGPYDCLSDCLRLYQLLQRRPDDELFLRRLLEIAHLAEESGQLSLAAFLDFWAEASAEERAPMPEGLDAVRILTIHKAKGLEFEAVIIPFHHDDNRLNRELTLVNAATLRATRDQPLAGGPVLLTRRCRELGEAYDSARLDSLAESLHVLYVAWTRPVAELHAILQPEAGRSALRKALNLLLEDLGRLPQVDGPPVVHGQPPAPRRPFLAAAPPEGSEGPLSPLAPACPAATADPCPDQPAVPSSDDEAFAPMAWLPRLKVYRNELSPANFARRRRGTLLHRCLERLALPDAGPDADFEAGPDAATIDAAVNRALDAGLRGLANPHDPAAFAKDREELAEDLRAPLTWLASLPQAWPWLTRGLREVELLTPDDDLRRLDCIYKTPDRLEAIDFKTGDPRPEDEAQVRVYLRLLRAMHPEGPPPVGWLVYVDERAVVAVEERA